MKNKGGRPTSYYPEVCEEMREFFINWPEFREVEREVASGGRKLTIMEKLVNYPPTLNKFAIKLGVHRDTLQEWSKVHPEFSVVYRLCKSIQEEWWSDRGVSGEYNPGFSKLMLVNHSDIKDKVTHDVSDDMKNGLRLAYGIDSK
jgi:hypothetical protein